MIVDKLKREGTETELAKYHKCNLGILSPQHPPYLDVSSSLSHMLDHVVVTFICAEKLSQRLRRRRHGAHTSGGAGSSGMNSIL
ncbi:hypothetical protein ID866_3798 [Astraeus odoratus]|nr:hypothetical protein ID866_3798 [Astraeus odoratus]